MLGEFAREDRILILSPHLDDAVLSAGGLIHHAVEKGSRVIVGNMFTADAQFSGEPSDLVKELHDWWQLGPKPYETRRKEDATALGLLGADVLQGGLLDAIYRTGGDGKFLYTSRKAVFSPPLSGDPVWGEARSLVASWMDSVRPTQVIAPMAVGRHLDHVVTTEAFRLECGRWNAEVYLYEDLPYSTGAFPPAFPDSVSAARERSGWTTDRYVDIVVDFEAKFSAIMKYESQIAEIFPGLDPERELRRYMARDDGKTCFERYWKVGNTEGDKQ